MRNNFVKLFKLLYLGQCFRCFFKRFSIWSSGSPPVRWSGNIYAILKEGIMRNIHVKLYDWTSGSGGDVVKRHFLSSYLELWTETICAILEEGIMRNNPVN